MRLEDYFVTVAPADVRLRGTRVGIETVLYDFIHRGDAPEAIAARCPSLTLEQVYATITYYLHDKDAVGAYLAAWLEHGRRMREAQERNPRPSSTGCDGSPPSAAPPKPARCEPIPIPLRRERRAQSARGRAAAPP